jgi:hypothetical protein
MPSVASAPARGAALLSSGREGYWRAVIRRAYAHRLSRSAQDSYWSQGTRDLRLDFLRGFAVVAMVVDHMGDHSWLHAITLGDNFYTSAAEGFVVLSGLLAGMTYRLTFQRYGLAYAVRKALRRARRSLPARSRCDNSPGTGV